MQVYKSPLKDFRFLLETFGYDDVHKLPGYGDYDLDTMMSLFEAGDVFAREQMLPLNRVGDQQGVSFDPKTGAVKTADGFPELYKKYLEQGYASLAHEAEYGGGGAPSAALVPFNEMFVAANKNFSMCTGLSHGLIESLAHYGTDEQKKQYLPHLVSGKWSGTMCLTEPQCGTDLGLLTTKAEPNDDGTYALTGTKIWITFGDHDMAENIVHLVLARLPGAPDGIKGISTFVVPKTNADGTANGIVCGGLEHKMGIHGSPTCVMNLENARGELLGEAHKGMRAMFVMMNAARLFVGIEGVALADISYQTAVAFAKDRRQGRSVDRERREKGVKADNILVHPDVRRMLLNVRSTTEGLRALGTWIGMLLDHAQKNPDEKRKGWSDDIVSLLTPVIKSFGTEIGFKNISESMQVLGGAGYTTDWSIEQYMRDQRISLLYEGTNGIQALDLIGRKLPEDNGRLYRRFSKLVMTFAEENATVENMKEFAEPLNAAIATLNEVTMTLGMKGMQDREEAAAGASNYLNLFGYVSLAYVWGVMAKAALERNDAFAKTKVKTARYYFKHVLPEIDSLVKKVHAGKAEMMDFDVDEF